MRKAIISIAILTLLSAAAQVQAGLISEKSEIQMGRDAAAQIESKYRVSSDRNLTAKVQSIGRKIAARSSRPNLPWQFKVLENKDVNACSVPAYVYVNSGLIDFIGGDANMLAAVIGHEVGHTAAHHAVHSAEKQLAYSLVIQFLSKKGDAQKLGNVAANLALLGYGRQDEFEADKLGVRYMRSAGYDPNGMLKFFQKLQQKEGKGSSGLAVYFRSHPPTSERIERVKQEINGR